MMPNNHDSNLKPKRPHSEVTVKPEPEDGEMAVDVGVTEDLTCTASLIGYHTSLEGGRKLLAKPSPLKEGHEPQEIVLDEQARAAMNAAGLGKEVKDPLDYAQKSHELCANARFAISTNKSATAERELLEKLKDALLERELMESDRVRELRECNERIDIATKALETTAQSFEIRPDKVTLHLDPKTMEFRLVYYFTNHTNATASFACELWSLEGTTLADSYVTIDGYADKSEYMPKEEALETVKKLNASSNKGACLQEVSKKVYAQTVKIPAWAGGDGPQKPATFSATFVLSCDDREAKSHLLPTRGGEPTYQCSDFAVQPPAGNVPFELIVQASTAHGAKLDLPSRAAAKHDAKLRGEPTYWVEPTGDEPCRIELTTPAKQPPCLRLRFTTLSDSEYDFLADAMGKSQIGPDGSDGSDLAQAKVLCYAPTERGESGKRVALVKLTAPKKLPNCTNGPGKEIHMPFVLDLSGSMGMRQNGSPHTNRILACKEVERVCQKMLDLPKQFVKAGIASNDDTFLLSIVGFHSRASTFCTRVPIVSDSVESKAAIERAVADVCKNQETGGTMYTSWARLVKTLCKPTDRVVLGLWTDGALWDADTFVPAYEELKEHVQDFASYAIGCGAWANQGTVKMVATHGATLIEAIDPAVSSATIKGLSRCVAWVAAKIPITISGQVLSQKGDKSLPVFHPNPNSPQLVDSVYELGLGEEVTFTVSMDSVSDFCMHQGVERRRINVRGDTAVPDVKLLLSHLDPLYTDKDITTLKNPDHPSPVPKLLEAIGVTNQCNTSEVRKVTAYELGEKYDHTLPPDVKAVVPAWHSGPELGADLAWLQQLDARTTTATNAKTVYEQDEQDWSDNDGCPVYRSLADAAGEAEPMQTEAPAPAPAPGKKADKEKPTEPNATPTYGEVARLSYSHTLLKYLNDHTLAHLVVGKVLEELKKVYGGLHSNGAGGKEENNDDDQMDGVWPEEVKAVFNDLASPSTKDVIAKINALLPVLCSFVMRYHLPVDVNLYAAPIAEGDVDMATRRVEYLIEIATRLHTLLLSYRPELWRAELKTECVAPDNVTIKTTLEWVREDFIRPFRDRTDTDPKEVVNNACHILARAFNQGAYKGGTFCSEGMLFVGPKPAAFADKEFKLGVPFVPGRLFAFENLSKPFQLQIAAAM